ncbi:hypothetical protein GDO81_011719 [Engystomops pustulosus]|uniref:Uncharacterized protein n=1 Tax=Engystomops pustulosus TaxID=76066 RepID=A0AAV7BG66_ENGPU|nr:hypothetical protein GDO81_011719 [Engystomops pustulosus]
MSPQPNVFFCNGTYYYLSAGSWLKQKNSVYSELCNFYSIIVLPPSPVSPATPEIPVHTTLFCFRPIDLLSGLSRARTQKCVRIRVKPEGKILMPLK